MKKSYDNKHFMKTLSVILAVVIVAIFVISLAFLVFKNSDAYYSNVRLYFLNEQSYKWETEERRVKIDEQDKMVVNVLNELKEGPQNTAWKLSVPENVAIASIAVSDDGTVEVHFSPEFNDMDMSDTIQCRTSLVLTLTELSFVNKVMFFVGDDEVMRSDEQPLGAMSRENFVTALMPEKETKTITLYFANESMTRLVKENRVIVINPNRTLSQCIVDELIKGPASEEAYRILPQESKVINVNIEQQTCYVDFSAEFVNKFSGGNETKDLLVYSIVNSLTEPDNTEKTVKKVQFFIEGGKYTGNLPLDLTKPYERDENFIEFQEDNS